MSQTIQPNNQPVQPVRPAVPPAGPAVPPAGPAVPPAGPAVPPAVANPVEEAAKKLSFCALDNLWRTCWTDAAWYAKLPGLLSYLWNKSAAVAEDAQAGDTLVNFNKATTELVNIVANRALREREAAGLNTAQVEYSLAFPQSLNAEREAKTAEALDNFYAAFSKRVEKLGINTDSDTYCHYIHAAGEILSKQLPTGRNDFPLLQPTKIATTIYDFNGKIFLDMVGSYASKPLNQITIPSFKEKVESIKEIFPAIDTVDIETSLREQLKIKHDTAEFTDLRTEYMNPSPTTQLFINKKGTIRNGLLSEQTTLQAELAALNGVRQPDGKYNGTIQTAWDELQAANTALGLAKAAFLVQCGAYGTYNDATSVVELLAFDDSGANANLIAAKNTLRTAYQTQRAKQQVFDTQHARGQQIAVYTNGQITGGRLAEITQALQDNNLNAKTVSELRRIGHFYAELNVDVKVVDSKPIKDTRSAALHQIMDPVNFVGIDVDHN